MSSAAAAAAFISGPISAPNWTKSKSKSKSKKGVSFHHYNTHLITLKSADQSSLLLLLIRKSSNGSTRIHSSSAKRPFSPVMQWQDCRAEIEVDVPASAAYDCYSNRERIPEWMHFISSVKILEDKPDVSRWLLKYEAFGCNVEFTWLARNMQPIRNQKIHWRSLEGLPNKGAVRFFPKGPSSCRVELTLSYEIPEILIPVASALQPFTEELLYRGLETFATVAKKHQKEAPQSS